MNLSQLFGRPVNDIGLGLALVQLCQAANSASPNAAFAAVLGGSATDPDISFFPGNNVQTNAIISNDGNRLVIAIGGALTTAQIGSFIDGVAAGPDSRDNLGCASNFYVAARSHLNDSFGRGGYAGQDVLITGHSYGGAVAQVAAAYLLSLGQARSVMAVSFGSPRPGGSLLARRLQTMQNVRWMADGDIVPWLLPHVDEIPVMPLICARTLWDQTDSMVQGPLGYRVTTAGQVIPTMGSPPANWGYFLSLANYVSSLMVGGAGPHHSTGEYIAKMQAALAANPTRPAIVAQQPEAVTTLRPRERAVQIAIGEAEVFSDATSPSGETRTYIVPPVTSPMSPRYRAARDGRLWVVKLGEDIVGAATGKKSAKRIARRWNRAARATLVTGV